MSMSMRKKVFGNLLQQEQAFFEQRAVGDLTSRLNNDVDQMQGTLNRTPETLAVSLTKFVVSLAMMCRTSLPLTAFSILPLPFLLRIVKRTAKVVGHYGVAQNDAMANVNKVADEALRNARTVQAHAAEPEERRDDNNNNNNDNHNSNDNNHNNDNGNDNNDYC